MATGEGCVTQVTSWRGSRPLDGDGLAPQIPDRVDPVASEQLEAADVGLGQHDDRLPGVCPDDKRGGEVQADMGLVGGEGLCDPGPRHGLDVVHLGEPLAPKELFGDVLGGDTDAGDLDQPDLRRLGGLRGNRPKLSSQEPCCPRGRQPTQTAPTEPKAPISHARWGDRMALICHLERTKEPAREPIFCRGKTDALPTSPLDTTFEGGV
jgi:hypothetical protein